MKKLFLSIVVLFIAGCAPLNFGQSAMPDTMPEDFNFTIQFGYDKKNEINTYENKIRKDLIENGIAEAPFTFTDEEMQYIYEKMKEVNIIGDKKLEPGLLEDNCQFEPHEDDAWKITINDETYRIEIPGHHCYPTDDAEELLQLRYEIFKIVKGKDAYKQLPKAVGGYD
ncbi:hypothetical protein [Oceanobacillus sp. CAU 1775]